MSQGFYEADGVVTRSNTFVTAGLVVSLLIIAITSVFLPILRQLGPIVIISSVALPVLVIFFTAINNQHITRHIIPYIPFVLIASAVVILSILNLMPDSWSGNRNVRYIPQQYSFYIVYILIVYIFTFLLTVFRGRISIKFVYVSAALVYFLNTLASFISEKYMNVIVDRNVSPWSIYNLVNSDGFVLVSLIIAIELSRFRTAYKILFSLLILLCCPGSGQNQLAVLCYIAIKITGSPKMVLLGLVTVLVSSIIMISLYPLSIYSFDKNLGVRGVFWQDCFGALWDTKFVGVGFGNESIKNNFRALNVDWKLGDIRAIELTGMHNSFLQTAYRGGLPLMLALLGWVAYLIKQSGNGSTAVDTNIRYWSVCTFIISLNLNPSLESANFIFLDGMLTGLVIAGADRMRRQTHAARRH